MDVPAEEPAGETREPAQASNGWLGGPSTPTNDSDNVPPDIDMDNKNNENVAAQGMSRWVPSDPSSRLRTTSPVR